MLRQFFQGHKDKLMTRPDVLRGRKPMFENLWYSLTFASHLLPGFRIESTVHLQDDFANTVGPLEPDGFPTFESFVQRGMDANIEIKNVMDYKTYTVNELLLSSFMLNQFCAARFNDGGYELFCCTRGNARSKAGVNAPGRPKKAKAHRKATGALLMDSFGNSNLNLYKNSSTETRHDFLLLRYQDFYAKQMLHYVEPIENGVWRRFV
jgi:hypothetical protein